MNEGERQLSNDKHKLKGFMATKQVLPKTLKAILHSEEKDEHIRPQERTNKLEQKINKIVRKY